MAALQHNEPATRLLFTELKPADKIEILHEVKVGQQVWTTRTVGTVVSTERRRHGLHFRRSLDDKVWSDVIILKQDDGSQTTVTIDEYTDLRRI
jgi:hypothetical protein